MTTVRIAHAAPRPGKIELRDAELTQRLTAARRRLLVRR
jgi:hypothetical protein